LPLALLTLLLTAIASATAAGMTATFHRLKRILLFLSSCSPNSWAPQPQSSTHSSIGHYAQKISNLAYVRQA
jgi:hypothetical protein